MAQILKDSWLSTLGLVGTLLASASSLSATEIQTPTLEAQPTPTTQTWVEQAATLAISPEDSATPSASSTATLAASELVQPLEDHLTTEAEADVSELGELTVGPDSEALAIAPSLEATTPETTATQPASNLLPPQIAQSPSPSETSEKIESNLDSAQMPQVSALEANSGLAQVTSVSQLSDVQPTDWAFQALQSLVERYGCIVGYPDGTYRGNRALTRYEFAAGLNACLDRVNELIQAGTANLVSREDLATLQRLQEEFAAELATLRGRVDALEGRTAELEANQFSTTTKLVGEGIFSLATLFGEQVEQFGGDNTVLQNRVRLGLQTSFTGQDLLNTRLTAGNVQPFTVPAGLLPIVPDGTAEGILNSRVQGNTGNSFVLDRLDYSFPVGDRIQAYVAATGGRSAFFVPSTVNPFFEDFDGTNGSISAFSQQSPIYRIGGGAGAGLSFALDRDRRFVLSAGYLADRAADPNPGGGLFNGDFVALGQLTFRPSDAFEVGLTYVRGYHRSNNRIFDLGVGTEFYTGTVAANAIHIGLGVPATTNSYGAQASLRLSRQLVLNAFGGYTDLDLIGAGRGEVWYYGLGLALPDLFKPGSLGGIMVGVEPYLGGLRQGQNLGALGLRNDTSLHIEGFYKYQLTDNVSITPGVIWVTNPDQNRNNSDYVVLTLRTGFTF